MRFLPDANVLIRFLNSTEPDKSYLEELLKENQLFISPITIAEVGAKATTEQERDLRGLIGLGTVVSIGEDIGFVAGSYRQQFSGKTKKVYLLDCLVAATCKVYGLTLVTNDLKDYPMKDIKILKPS